jgi:2-keto-3-deoxy-L-rhamnonate aldolase RhmA
METQSDYKELFALLNAHGVDYVIVGAYALAFHGVPRNTGDVDVLVEATSANARRVIAALNAFGFGSAGLTEQDFTMKDHVIQLGVPPLRVDFMTSIESVPWAEAAASKVSGNYGGVPIWFLGRDALIKNKKATGRLRDRADIEALEKMDS